MPSIGYREHNMIFYFTNTLLLSLSLFVIINERERIRSSKLIEELCQKYSPLMNISLFLVCVCNEYNKVMSVRIDKEELHVIGQK